ncbi:hypothetical protein GE09DRAFT_1120977 [Coniochaeta sp. 2T2.1]|nr:hypothetical protein GE09DRAFT_1120977 [Coniochaeta sp. 2T2.1]
MLSRTANYFCNATHHADNSQDAPSFSSSHISLLTLERVPVPGCTAAVANPPTSSCPHTRVIGVTGLRVVDVSSFALLTPGHPQSTVYAFVEKTAGEVRRGL